MSVNARDDRGGGFGSNFFIDDYLDLERSRAFSSGVIVSTISDVLMIGTGEPERPARNYISMNTFDVMGVGPIVGARRSPVMPRRAHADRGAQLQLLQRRFGGDSQRARPAAALEWHDATVVRVNAAAISLARRRRVRADRVSPRRNDRRCADRCI